MTARLFELYRHTDVTGLSGTGVVAHGTQWPDGTVSLRWAGEWPSFSNWTDLETLLAVHGHQGATEAHFITGPDRVCRACGCSDDDACPTGCYWVARDLCSTCVVRLNEQDRDEERLVALGQEDEYAVATGAESPLESFDREDR